MRAPSLAILLAAAPLAAQAKVDFAREVWPLLEEHCFECHGEDTTKARLRLDAKAIVLRGGKSGPALVPGDAGRSLLWKRVSEHDATRRMPPDADPLPAPALALLRRWIEEGATWPDDVGSPLRELAPHWSYVAPKAGAAPTASGHPIDAFVAQGLHRAGLAPAPEADRATLLRRVTLDLTGLLPGPEEVAAFLGDTRTDAYERVVDRLLASPHYGEHLARSWLDAARYADTDGYAIDAPRPAWRWREWVVQALNADLPFDRFTELQLAGDLLPDATAQDRLATGFHRNTMRNEEGGVDPEEFRVEAVKDRVNTTATVWLGLTLACAQCHDHKYDAFTQREYYELYAFWNDADEHDELVDESRPKDRDARALVLRARKEPRTTHVQVKGDFQRHGEVVTPGTPRVLPPLATASRPTRRDLARWLVAPDNPLTARVQVNRHWQRLFGAGLVATENDFGTQGTAPTHPELLDWLALEFVRLGWSQKALLRLLVTSRTYRQSSRFDPEAAAKDPTNRWLARQARIRLPAEAIRDAALAASGLLVHRLGGPSVYPPIPEGVTSQGQVERVWKTSQGEDRYRRGLYTAFWRSTPHPMLTLFDAPLGVESCTRRNLSNTPLQALTLLDDEAFFECARALAARVERAAAAPEARVEHAFLLCLQRPPSTQERAIAERVLRDHGALAFCRMLLNLDAFLTRE